MDNHLNNPVNTLTGQAKDTKSLNNLPQTVEIKKLIDPSDYLVNLGDDIPDPDPIFKINNVLVASPGNLLTVKAKQKAGKGFCLSILIASLFRSKYFEIEGFRNGKIALLDFEQSINQVHKVYRRTHTMSGFVEGQENPDLKVYYGSELEVPERWELFEMICMDEETSIVVLDTATDLITDINDASKTKSEVDKLQAIAKRDNKLIIATIHENKADSNATGHFGGSLQKKSEAVISLTKSDGIFTITATDTRHGDWPDFSFIIDGDGYPVSMETPVKLTSTEVKENNIKDNLNRILAVERLLYSELEAKYIAHEICSDRTAQRHIKTALQKSWIKVQSDNRYILTKRTTDDQEF
jgi:hypothetical protein